MAIKRPPLINDEIYHVILRGVGDTKIFEDDSDRYRGVFSIYEFNTTKPIEIRLQREKRQIVKKHGGQTSDVRDRIVDILAFCFMPNHVHLLIKQLKDNGITKFIKKVGTGYATYFNKKYVRKGHLFQGRFQAVRIKDDNQLKIVFAYIHSNPLSLIEPNWKENGIRNLKKSIKFLESYKWSSYLDYIGEKAFPSVTNRDLITGTLNNVVGCREFINNVWIKYRGKIKEFSNTHLE